MIFAIALLAALVFGAPGCAEEFRQARYLMGTIAEIHLLAESESEAEQAFDAAFAEMTRIDRLMSNWKDDSEISLVNREAGNRPVQVSQDLLKVMRASIKYSRLSSGAYDVTAGPLVRLWGFLGGDRVIPSDQDISEALEFVSYRRVILDRQAQSVRFLKEGVYVDLGGIAKGYAVDKAVEALKQQGISRALINLGGNIYAMDTSPNGQPWEVEVQHPMKGGGAAATLRLRNQGAATSGDYEKLFVVDGKRYSHIIDPRTGRPASESISVTIVSPSAMEADAMSTAVFVLGPEAGIDSLKKLPGCSAVIINKDLEIIKWSPN